MKILLTLISICYLQVAFAGSRFILLTSEAPVDLNETDVVEIVGVGTNSRTSVEFTHGDDGGTFSLEFNRGPNNPTYSFINSSYVYTGVRKASVFNGPVTLKITPAAANVTTSKPVIVPPTSASDTKWNVQLQVSTDLKNWEDVVPGEFLGSDKVRFFRVKSTTGSDE
ncbi:hypothetical protein N9198_02155 [Akkermansiaceae bacterium]|nr:hypothetical protein [Akkermansiaceae bacterium]